MEVPEANTERLRIAALDGLRGLAVLAVVLFHFKSKPLLPGGSFGVDLFLALSGYLITTLLLLEWKRTGSINLGRFYLRRAFRLLPALAVLLVVGSAISILLRDTNVADGPNNKHLLTGIGLAVGYAVNWALVLGYQTPKLIGPLWSLSLEEQFYFLWPGIVLVLMKLGGRRALLAATAILIACSLLTPYFVIGGSWDRVDWRRLYYGSDFRAHGLLIGSLAAQLMSWEAARSYVSTSRGFRVVSMAVAGFLLMLMMTVLDKNPVLYLIGGFALLSASCSVLVLYAANVTSGAGIRVLSLPPLQYLGRRSYAIYLWHFPIGFWLNDLAPVPQVILASALTLLAAEVSYRLVEGPALRYQARRTERRQAATEVSMQQFSPLRVGVEDAAA